MSELKPTEGAEDEQPRAAVTRGRRPGRIRRLRGWLATPILWWTGSPDEIPPLEQSGWERGKADAIHAAKDGRTFGLVATAVTLAAPTAVGLATTRLPTGWQIALIVLAGVLGYMLVPVLWAAGSAIAAPTIQRNEARLRLQELTEASTAAAEVDRAKSQLAAALRTGHLLGTISAPPLDQEWLAQTEFLIRDAVGELEAARLDPRETVSRRRERLQALADDVSKGVHSPSPRKRWDLHALEMTTVEESLESSLKTAQYIRGLFFAKDEELSAEDAEKWVSSWLSDTAKTLGIVPNVRRIMDPPPGYWATYKGLPDGLSAPLWKLDSEVTRIQAIVPTLKVYCDELHGVEP